MGQRKPKRDDPWRDDPTVKAWIRHVLDEMAPKMADSALVMQLVPDGEGDVKFWVELGASIMMDKPIIAVAFGDTPIPAKLELIADEVVRLKEGVNPAASEELAAALERMIPQDQ
jgi:hypothetical protein